MSSVDDKDTVHATFQEQHKAVEVLLDKLKTVPADERPQVIDSCLAGISGLSDLAKDAASYLPAYDQRAYSLKIKTLSDQLSQIRQSLAPKQKFSFKAKRNNIATIGGAVDIGAPAAPSSAPTAGSRARVAAVEQENLVIAAQTGTHIRPTSSTAAAEAASLLLSSLRECIVALPEDGGGGPHFSSAAVKNVSDSLLLLGNAVNGPIHLTAVSDSVLVFSCRQFRMHDARNVDVFLRCTSRPIIEDCQNIRFHTYGADEGNLWDQVDDFKWLRSEESPHWTASRSTEQDERRWRELAAKDVGELDVKAVLDEVLSSQTAR